MIKLLYPKFWQSRNLIAYLLWPLSLLYSFAGYIRRLTADPIKIPAKVICVGNISIGGTGKTQIVILLAQLLSKMNINFIIITKGYGSKLKSALLVKDYHNASDVGDESVLLSKYGRVIATKKIQYILPFLAKIKPSVIIVDDAMQNPNFYKDFVIMSVDDDRLFGNGFLIPAGPLRQYPKFALNNIDATILVGSNNVSKNLSLFNKKNLFYAQIVPSNNLDKTKNYFAFSGIGNPNRFFNMLKNYGLKLSGTKIYPDHHQYIKEELEYLKSKAKEYNATLITTRKDYIKIHDKEQSIISCDVELVMSEYQQFQELIHEKTI